MAATRQRPQMPILIGGAAMFGAGLALAAAMPNAWLFGAALAIVGASAQTFTTSGNSTVQLSTEPAMRGRVVAILIAIALGGTPVGAPIAGWVADRFGPRWSLIIGAASGFAAVVAGLLYLVRYRHLTARFEGGRLRFRLDPVA